MKQQWEQWSLKVMEMSQRERLMLLAAAIGLIWAVCDALVLTPAQKNQKAYRAEIATKRDEVSRLQLQQVDIINASKADPDADKKRHVEELQNKIRIMDARLQEMQSELIPPERMPSVLEHVLQRDRSIRLVSLETLPVSSLQEAVSDPKAPASDLGIYKHAFRVRIEGGYLDLIRYVSALETSRWKMNWDELKLEAGAYPKSTLTLTLYTLSLDRTWLSI